MKKKELKNLIVKLVANNQHDLEELNNATEFERELQNENMRLRHELNEAKRKIKDLQDLNDLRSKLRGE